MMAVDDDAFEPTLVQRTLELGDGGRRIADRQRRQAEKPRRMAADSLRERSVRASREGLRLFDIELLYAGRVSDSACMVMPAASIAATRPSPIRRADR